jgi:hypothetical protein
MYALTGNGFLLHYAFFIDMYALTGNGFFVSYVFFIDMYALTGNVDLPFNAIY